MFGRNIFSTLKHLLRSQLESVIDRASLAALFFGKSTRLIDEEFIPVITTDCLRGIYGWTTEAIVKASIDGDSPGAEDASRLLTEFVEKIYNQFRNPGADPRHRALNYAAVNLAQASQAFSQLSGRSLQISEIQVVRSSVGRPDGNCWDIITRLTHHGDQNMADKIVNFTVDVVDMMPVTVNQPKIWSVAPK